MQPTATASRKTDQILIPNYLETLADSAIDPSLKHLTDTFNVESTASPRNQTQGDVQGGTETGDDFSWLPDFKNTISQSNALTLYPWPLDTTLPFIPSTQPTSSDTGSPASPFPNGPPGSVECPNNVDNGMIDSSPSTSASDHGGIAGRVGISSTSSESGLEAGGTKDDTVPPPPKKKSHARKQPEGHIKRARNAFILFRKHITDSNLIPPSVEVKHQNISVVAAKMWKEAPQEVRQNFQEQARIEKEEHQRKYPGYRYQPVFRRTDIIRRRVRKDPAEDERVDAVAEALINGKAGNELEKEIKEQLVTRSEASESDGESSRGSRRRRRETGQLSKGAIRAQRAQARTKQMRQDLLGSNLLNISLYNAANARLASSTTATAATENDYRYHPGIDSVGTAVGHGHTHPGMQYAMGSNIQLGYGLDGRPVKVGGYSGEMYGTTALLAGPSSASDHESDMYQFPPMNGMMDVRNRYEWHAPSMQYWDQVNMGPEEVQPQGGYPVEGEYYATHYDLEGGVPEQMEYRFSSLMETSGEGNGSLPKRAPGDIIAGAYVAYKEQEDRNPSSIRQWAGEGQQTPSGHVMFNEKLFDGVMGSAGLFDKAEGPDVLAMFDGAMEHAGEIASW
ncbi:specific transcriptional repressor [Cryptococcus gattii EJB2]|uniref:Specific transcriptional repressor n=1 Tax=Cryptococcus gattii EJB2 TaxID=1296103 RepID=A0ABR5BVK8_9TREE|nr:specific transcriptional repressor [Cryptococcus gattii EJB2]